MAHARLLVALATALALSGPVPALATISDVVVNIDINLDPNDPNDPPDPGDGTHVGDDGVFSNSGGFNWNGVAVDSSASNLTDEFSGATPFDASVSGRGDLCSDCPTPDPNDPNDPANVLQNSGVTDLGGGAEILITDLVSGGSYDLAVYACTNSGFAVTHAGGTIAGFCNIAGQATCVLPGVDGRDYCTELNSTPTPLSGLMPFEVTTGVFGLRIGSLDGLVTGVQIRGPAGSTAPSPSPSPSPTATRTPSVSPSPSGRPTPSAELEHFQCYGVRGHRFAQAGVTLEDQFEESTVEVKNLKRLCLPASKNNQDPPAVDDPEHLAGYQIDQAGRFERRRVTVFNQFSPDGETVEVKRPEFLLVPTAKSLMGPTDPLDPVFTDHFKCYKVRGLRTRTDVTVEDQFGTLAVEVKRPRWLCNPVDKNQEGIIDPAAHLLCYKVRTRPRRPNFEGAVEINNQFGPDTIEAGRVDGTRGAELCVPSVKVDPNP